MSERHQGRPLHGLRETFVTWEQKSAGNAAPANEIPNIA
jgi:hypothetical protein